MGNQAGHLALLMLTAIMLLGAVSCGDEPGGKRHGRIDNTTTPADTTHRNDTTASDTTRQQPVDTIHTDTTSTHPATFTITVTAPRPYGYMGQTMQLTAATSSAATVVWRSTRTAAAWVDANGLVTFNNAINDDSTLIIATAAGVSDTVRLACRCWAVAAWDGRTWARPAYVTLHPADTIVLTIVDSHGEAIDDAGLNAAACQWTPSCYSADVTSLLSPVEATSQTRERRWVLSADAVPGTLITFMAQLGDAASAITCTVAR